MSIDAQVEQALKNRNFDSETESQLKLALQTEDQKRQFIQKPQNTRFLNQHLPFISKLKQQRASSTLPDVQFLQSLLDMLLQKQNRTDFIQAGGQQLLISMLQRVNLANSSSDLKLKIMSALKLLMNDSSGLIQAVKQPETILTVIKTLQCSESAEIQEKCLFILSCMSGLPREYYAIPVLVKALDLNSMELFQSRFYLVFCLARNYTKLEEETCFEFSVYLQLIFNNITNEDLNQDLNSRQQFREELIEAGYDDYSDKMIKKLHQWLRDTADVSTRSSIMLKKQDLGVQELLNIAKEADPDSQGTTILNLLDKYEQQRAHDQELATLMENYGLQEYDFNYLTGDLLDQLQLKFQNLNYLNQASFKQLVLRLLKLISMNYNSTSYALEALNTFTQQCVDFVQESEISSIEHILQNRPKPKIKPTTVYDILTKELSDQQLLDELTQLCDCDLTTLVKNAKKESAYNSDLKIKSSALKYKMKLVPNYEKEQVETALKTMKENDFVIKGLQRELNQALLDVQSLKEQILKNNSENIQSSVVKTENEDQDQENSSQQNIESVNSINDSEHTQDKQVINQQSINNVDITEKVKIKKPSRKADTSGESTNKEQKIKPQMPKSRHINENIESPQAQTNNDDKQQLIIQIELLNKTIYEQKDIISKLKEVPANSGLPPPPANGLSLPPSGGLPPPPANGLSLPPSGGLPPPPANGLSLPPSGGLPPPPANGLSLPPPSGLPPPPANGLSLPPSGGLPPPPANGLSLPPSGGLPPPPANGLSLPPSGGLPPPQLDYRYSSVVFHLRQLMDYRYLLQVVFHLRQLMDYRYLLQVVFHLRQLMDYRYLLQVVFHLRQLMDYRYLLQVVFHLRQLMDYRYLLQVVFHLRQLMDYRYLLQVVFHLQVRFNTEYLIRQVRTQSLKSKILTNHYSLQKHSFGIKLTIEMQNPKACGLILAMKILNQFQVKCVFCMIILLKNRKTSLNKRLQKKLKYNQFLLLILKKPKLYLQHYKNQSYLSNKLWIKFYLCRIQHHQIQVLKHQHVVYQHKLTSMQLRKNQKQNLTLKNMLERINLLYLCNKQKIIHKEYKIGCILNSSNQIYKFINKHFRLITDILHFQFKIKDGTDIYVCSQLLEIVLIQAQPGEVPQDLSQKHYQSFVTLRTQQYSRIQCIIYQILQNTMIRALLKNIIHIQNNQIMMSLFPKNHTIRLIQYIQQQMSSLYCKNQLVELHSRMKRNNLIFFTINIIQQNKLLIKQTIQTLISIKLKQQSLQVQQKIN
ncbi:Diaphanous_GTPase-binding Domain domain-containing protein [Hexamita inflata]|uniref:Diaphanous GTPase-binding Domain domain-containing protein n=1 Tax=Hexamita inflata TaxID=28002 RepID=A0AA86PLT3_9EUKA|nr:Diaphanous GTPase-binding Domain domain-containing protein [Hexamita inflata]